MFWILIKSLPHRRAGRREVGAGVARMFHAPTTQGMGAFRTLRTQLCEATRHPYLLGWVFFFNARASSVAAGSFTRDVDHRIIPNPRGGAYDQKNRNVGATLHDPKNGDRLRRHRYDCRNVP